MTEFCLPDAPAWDFPALDDFAAAGLLRREALVGSVVEHCRGALVYLATPYGKLACYDDGEFDPSVSLECAVRTAMWARTFAVAGVTAVSPVIERVEMVHAHFVDQVLDPMDGPFWADWVQPLLIRCDAVVVPPLAGWAESAGVWASVRHALGSQKGVFLMAGGE